MITESNQIFRITYEAFSKFSSCLNRCRTFDEIADCFTVNLKYLFNYHVFRASYNWGGMYVHANSFRGNTEIKVGKRPRYLEYEKILADNTVPQRWTDVNALKLSECFADVDDEEQELWGWNFMNEERQIIVSVLCGSKKKFSQKDVNFIKLVADNLETKLLELCLIKELDEKNRIISIINEDQKVVIKERTREIEIKNKTLLEISVLNAHNVREPLSRILGLVNLMDEDQTEEMVTQVLPLLKTSSNDLDAALQNVINHATKDLAELKA